MLVCDCKIRGVKQTDGNKQFNVVSLTTYTFGITRFTDDVKESTVSTTGGDRPFSASLGNEPQTIKLQCKIIKVGDVKIAEPGTNPIDQMVAAVNAMEDLKVKTINNIVLVGSILIVKSAPAGSNAIGGFQRTLVKGSMWLVESFQLEHIAGVSTYGVELGLKKWYYPTFVGA